MILLSPAKVNLFLAILHKRGDGYHELASLFQTIDLCDTLHISLSAKDHLSSSDPALPADHRNLVMKAILLFREKTGLQDPISAHIEKKIPQEAGLGGGSSNAATTLWALNQLFGEPASLQSLRQWGAELGSDVPFFFSGGTAYCTGRGEIIRDVTPLENGKLTIIKPKFGLSTPVVYSHLDLATLPSRDTESALRSFYEGKPLYFNDLEHSAFKVAPELLRIKKKLLEHGFTHVLLCGSGSSLFCLGQGDIDRVKRSEDVLCYEAKFIKNSPHWYIPKVVQKLGF